MAWWLLAAILAAPGAIQQRGGPMAYQACESLSVSLAVEQPEVSRGETPSFSVAVTNRSDWPARVLDVRNGRRSDLQESYYELYVIQGSRVVDVPVMISDPGPLWPDDFFELQPGARVEFRQFSHKRRLENLPPGAYQAFILFSQDPLSSVPRCRSTSAPFTVHD